LDTILKEYRRGARQPSILSQAILDNRRIDKDELLVQVNRDLEDKDVHPDSINFNQSFIDSWLSEVVSEGGLDEISPDNQTSEDAPGTTPLIPDSTTEEETLNSSAPGYTDERAYQNLHPDTGNGLMSIADNVTVAAPQSRPNSVSSHRSKAADWHPYDRPDPDYVQSMLATLFDSDPFVPYDEDRFNRRVSRAFYQQDWSEKGYLTRPDVMQVCVEVLKRSGPAKEHNEAFIRTLQSLVADMDINRDGQFDLGEFNTLFRELLTMSNDEKKREIIQKLDVSARSARNAALGAQRKQGRDTKFIMPWKWSRIQVQSSTEYLDEINNSRSDNPPDMRLTQSSYSNMALEADICVAKIDDFEQKWLGIVPKSLQQPLIQSLRIVRNAALSFTVFENQRDRFQISDLDSTVISYQILSKYMCESILDRMVALKDKLEAIEIERPLASKLLRHIQGFSYCLEEISKSNIRSIPQDFPQFQARWVKDRLEWCCTQIGKEAEVWDGPVKQDIKAIRESKDCKEIELNAVSLIKEKLEKRSERKSILEELPWQGKLVSVEISDWKVARKAFRSSMGSVLLIIWIILTFLTRHS
jgi:hypothetical protein